MILLQYHYGYCSNRRDFFLFFSFSDLAEGTVTEGGRKEVDGAKRE